LGSVKIENDGGTTVVAENDPYHVELDSNGIHIWSKANPPIDGRNVTYNGFLSLSVEEIKKGAHLIPIERSAWRYNAHYAMRNIAGGIVEKVAVRDREIEWDFVLESPMPYEGDLQIVASLCNTGASGREADNLTPTRDINNNFSFGDMIVRDRTGQEFYRCKPLEVDGKIILKVPDLVLRGASYPVVVDPTIGPEYSISEPIFGFESASSDKNPSVTWNGEEYFAVCQVYENGCYKICGARLDANGQILDKTRICLSSSDQWKLLPSVCSDGNNFFVVWLECIRDNYFNITDLYVKGIFIGPDGNILGDGEFEIFSTSIVDHIVRPAVGYNGSKFLVTWSYKRKSCDMLWGCTTYSVTKGALITAPGEVEKYFTISGNAVYNLTIGSNEDEFLVVWAEKVEEDDSGETPTNIYGAKVSDEGQILGNRIDICTVGNDQRRPAVIWDGSQYLVVWEDKRNSTDEEDRIDIYGTRVSADGTVLDTSGIPICAEEGDQFNPSLAWDGSENYLIAYEATYNGDEEGIYAISFKLTEDGDIIEPKKGAVGIAPKHQNDPSAVWDGSKFFILWEDWEHNTGEIYGRHVSSSLTLYEGTTTDRGIRITLGVNEQENVSIAWNGEYYLAVWEDDRSGQDIDIYGARIAEDGTKLDEEDIQICTAA